MKNKPKNDFCFEDIPIGALIAHIARIHMTKIHRSLESYGVQKTYGPILKELSTSEGITQTELAGNMRITAPSMSVSLQKMENAGLLIRKNDETDLRQVRLYLSEKGKIVAAKAEQKITLLDEKLVEILTDDEKKELKQMLLKMIDNLTDKGGETLK